MEERTTGTKYSKNKIPENVTSYRDRHGVLRWRFRAGGFTAELGRDFGSSEFWERLADAHKGQKASAYYKTSSFKYGTLGWLIGEYRKTPIWTSKKASTKRAYNTHLNWLEKNHGTRRLNGLQTKHLQALIGKFSHVPSSGNNLRKRLNELMRLAVHKGFFEHNIAKETYTLDIPNKGGIYTWTEEDVFQYIKQFPAGTDQYLALMILLYTGMARSDAARFGWKHIKNGRITYLRLKTETTGGLEISIPIHPKLMTLLEEVPETQDTFIATRKGKPRSPDSFGNEMRKWCDKAGLPDCTPHGLRKALATRLADAGATTHEIAAVTGHKSLSLVEHYTRAANRKTNADRAMAKLYEAEINPKIDEPFDLVRQKSSQQPENKGE